MSVPSDVVHAVVVAIMPAAGVAMVDGGHAHLFIGHPPAPEPMMPAADGVAMAARVIPPGVMPIMAATDRALMVMVYQDARSEPRRPDHRMLAVRAMSSCDDAPAAGA